MKASDYKQDFVPETGLAKSRIKQYLETASTNGNTSQISQSPSVNYTSSNGTAVNGGEGEDLPKGLAKSLLAKWKSIENVKDKETSPEPLPSNAPHRHSLTRNTLNRAVSRERLSSPTDNGVQDENLPQSGSAKSLLNKWQNIEPNTTTSNNRERRALRPITPPPPEELEKHRVITYNHLIISFVIFFIIFLKRIPKRKMNMRPTSNWYKTRF